MTKRNIVLTGACGYIAGRMLDALRERYDLTLLDARTSNRDGVEVPGVIVVNLASNNHNAYRAHFRGADAVIHCAFVQAGPEATPQERFNAELANVNMAYNVYQVAADEGVRRVVVASSNHAADYYERLIWTGKWDVVTPEMRPLSDNFYGWAKEAYEHLGFVFACGKEGSSPLSNVQLRIGGPRETDVANCPPGDLKRLHRALGAYLSIRDQVQLFVKSLEAEDIRDDHGIPFQIFYGVSDNTHNFWSIVNARKVIGYAPEDNSQLRFADEIARHLAAARVADTLQ
jgi:UDP-glucose 4-epimerase